MQSVTPWDKNPRRNESAIPKVAASIRRFGFTAPLLVWASEGRLIAGHTRLAALLSILAVEPGFVPKGAPAAGVVPVRFMEFDSEAEAIAYTIADNRLASEAEWDLPALSGLVQELKLTDPTLLDLTGFDLPELEPLLRFNATFAPPSLRPDSPAGGDGATEGSGAGGSAEDTSTSSSKTDKPASATMHPVEFNDEEYAVVLAAVARWRRFKAAGSPDQSTPAIIALLLAKVGS